MTSSTSDVQGILEALNVSELPKEEQEELMIELGDLLYESVLVRLLERMDDATQEAFSKLIEKEPSEEEVDAFIRANVPDADSVVSEVIAELKSDILESTRIN